MKDIDIDWAKSQLEQKKVTADVGISVVTLLELWKELSHRKANDEQVLDIFSKLAMNNNLVKPAENEVWEPARPGFVRVGDTVRVLEDAFEGDLGRIHNGRIGKVVAVRYGDIIVKSSDNKEPVLDGSHYAPQKLEKLVAVL